MRTNLTAAQAAALPFYAALTGTRRTRAPHPTVQRSLRAKGWITDRPATDDEKRTLGRDVEDCWTVTELTPAGHVLLGQVDTDPATNPSLPVDPFAGMPDDDADPFTTETDRRL